MSTVTATFPKQGTIGGVLRDHHLPSMGVDLAGMCRERGLPELAPILRGCQSLWAASRYDPDVELKAFLKGHGSLFNALERFIAHVRAHNSAILNAYIKATIEPEMGKALALSPRDAVHALAVLIIRLTSNVRHVMGDAVWAELKEKSVA